MRMTLRLLLQLAACFVVIALISAVVQIQAERHRLRGESERRTAVIAENLAQWIETFPEELNSRSLNRLFDRYVEHEHLVGIVVYDAMGRVMAITPELVPQFGQQLPLAAKAHQAGRGLWEYRTEGESDYQTYALPVTKGAKAIGTVVVVANVSSIHARLMSSLRGALTTIFLQTLLITALLFVLLHSNFLRPISATTQWLRGLRQGIHAHNGPPPKDALFGQIRSEVEHMAQDLDTARAAAQHEANLRESQSALWTADRLRANLRGRFPESSLVVVSNREPYLHEFDSDRSSIRVVVPASGLVTALEPVLQACRGTWVANGTGSADKEVVDSHDHIQMPPVNPAYTLRRIWLDQEAHRGFYEGFSNEGLWPLCHIAHMRPIFRPEDWSEYERVNLQFAEAALQEIARIDDPMIWAQDYHLALFPRIVKQLRPDARVGIFWHIPWPNPEVFQICPWQTQLLDGMLGADLIGFHTKIHCNNFLATVSRAFEALADWDRMEVYRHGHVTRVRPYPISVELPRDVEPSGRASNSGQERAALLAELGVEASIIGVGVDRVDYTKGILERFRAIERFLRDNPAYLRRFTFIQIGSPSRVEIPQYREFLRAVSGEAELINSRLQSGRWKPIVFLPRHHAHPEIERYFRAASLCMVTSLHDGMNLVAKEFVSSRTDNRGVLILSSFTGAAQELREALLVNPYDLGQMSGVIKAALEMTEKEQAERMSRMRKIVRENNVYHWAASLIGDLGAIPVKRLAPGGVAAAR